MSEHSIISILHISDMHFTKRRLRDQEVVVDALVTDLEALCIGHRRPDVVVFTGDLVHAVGVDGHSDGYDFLLSRVLKATGCSESRLFIVPGNHDVGQAVVGRTLDVHREWREKADDTTAMNELFGANGFDEVASQKFLDYYELETYLNSDHLVFSDAFTKIYRIPNINIDVVVINTSMLSIGGHKELGRDEGKLAVPEHSLLSAVKALLPGYYRIFATHHPFGALTESTQRHLRSTVQKFADLHIFGHMHDPVSANIVGFQRSLFSDQAGAVFTQRSGAYIGYSLISVERDRELYETHLRTYFDDRKAFDEARDVVEQGRFYSSQKARQLWRTIAVPVDDRTFREHLAGPCLEAGWLPHTTRAALTRLRQRGFDIQLAAVDERRAYRLGATG